MTREQVIQELQALTKRLAQKYDCPNLTSKEDRQKGIWGEETTQILEKKYGECTKEIQFCSNDMFILKGYEESKDKETPCRSIEFRFRFATPCVAISIYEGQRKIFAEIEVSDFDANSDNRKHRRTGDNWHIEEITVFQEEGMKLAHELMDEWKKIVEMVDNKN